nr:discoidin, CUB and LCCL domain-containing protein 1-like [Crassostrea gigas]
MAVVTKGLNYTPNNEYVKKYKVKYSNTSSNWSTVQHGTTNEFIANSDSTTGVTNTLPTPIVARYIRVYPTECTRACCLRFDVIGCEASLTTPDATTALFSLTTTNSSTSALTTRTARIRSISINSSQDGACQCTCTKANGSLTALELKTKIEAVVQNLSVKKEKTSKYIRSKTSAQDSRPEVVYVGSVAIVILSLIASLVVLPDLYAMLRFFYSMLKRKQKINIADF